VVGYEKKEIGHLPTKLIEISPLNSEEFLLLKKRKISEKETATSSSEWGVSQLLPSP
jgi:hypothetical protein